MMVVFMNETLFKVANGRFYYVEVVGKRIPNRCCLWLRRVGHISRACAYRVSGYTDSVRPYWLRNIIFFSDILVLTFTYDACVCECIWMREYKQGVYLKTKPTKSFSLPEFLADDGSCHASTIRENVPYKNKI